MISIVFMGNCQLAAVHLIMQRHLARDFGLRTRFLASWTSLSDQDRDSLEQADVVVGQRLRFATRSDVEDLQSRGKTILVPLLGMGFLWPFAGAPHPRNANWPFHPYGPYPAEIGDSYLNRLLAEGMDPDRAVDQYLQLDVNSVVKLDRLREITTESQYSLDETTGFRLAPHMERFQQEPIFRSPHHCDTSILIELTCQIIEKIGLDTALADVVRSSVKSNPMLDVWLPIHPSVARHFNLHYGNEHQRYPYFGEGSFTFSDYARRYMTFTWNRPLHEGIHLSAMGCDEAALPALRAGILASPTAAIGHLRLSESLARLGDVGAAMESASRAVEFAPDNAETHGSLGKLLATTGDLRGAEAMARVAVELDPLNADLQAFVGWLVLRQQGAAEALNFIERANRLEPENAKFLLLHGDALLAVGQTAEAEAVFRQVIGLNPDLAAAHVGLSQALGQTLQWDAALAAMQDALILDPKNPDSRFFMAYLWTHQKRPVEAEAAYRSSIALAPGRAEFHAGLASFLNDEGRAEDALFAIEQAVSLAPDNAAYRALHDHLRNMIGVTCT